jgi:ABC-type bacteriocin/lantibiotic exporter with double-glycine peptidase domain
VIGTIQAVRRRGFAAALAVAAAALVSGCVSVHSNARPVARSTVSVDRGWIAVQGVAPVRQQSQLDCGPAALVMVVRRWGVSLDLRTATRQAGRRSGRGVRLGALRAVARHSGLSAFAIRADRATLIHELERGRPVLVGLLRGSGKRRLSHYEVVVGFHAGRGEVATIDPAAGYAVRKWADLAAEWDPAGRPALVVLGPDPAASRRAAR